jgi:hypothetical protein
MTTSDSCTQVPLPLDKPSPQSPEQRDEFLAGEDLDESVQGLETKGPEEDVENLDNVLFSP